MNIAIVGAGLTGRLMAWQCLEIGHKVTLLDKDNGGGELSAGIIAAAMLAPYSEILDAETIVYEQGLQGFAVWQTWSQELLKLTGIDIHLQLNGSIVVAHRNDNGDYQRLLKRLRTHPSINQLAIQELDKAALHNIEPELTDKFDKACYLSQEGCLDNQALFLALECRIKQLGGQMFCQKNIVELDDNALQGQFADYDKVIDCRGFGAVKNLSGLRGVRGEVIRVRAPEVNFSKPVRLLHPRYKLYIVPKCDHEYIIGATQIESSSEHAITVRSSLELLSALYSVHSGFSEAEILSQHARCRPAFADNLPRVENKGKLLSINGLYRHGYLLSPMVITKAMSLIVDESTSEIAA